MEQETIQGYRLSPQQKHLWLLLPSGQSAPYHSWCAVQIDGELDARVLQQALDHVVAQHEILRTTFQLLPGMTIPVQVIEEQATVSLELHKLTGLTTFDQDSVIDQFASEVAHHEIDWTRLPLLRADLVQESSRTHDLLLTTPALCADGPSLQILARQIADAYAAPQRRAAAAATETMQYADFAEWQHELLESEDAAAGRQYWKQFDLSPAFARRLSFEKVGGGQGFQPQVAALEISNDTAKRIREVAASCGASVSSFFLACWQTVLSRSTGWNQLTFGVAFDGRRLAELAAAIGLMSSYLPIQSDLKEGLRFTDFLRQANDRQREGQRWQEYFSLKGLNVDDGAARFLPFCFESRTLAGDFSTAGLTFSFVRQESCCEGFKLKFVCEESGREIAAELQYDANLFSSTDVTRLVQRLETLIADASKRCEESVTDLELLSEPERQLLLARFNDTAREVSTAGECIQQLFEAQVAANPSRIALVFEDQHLTYVKLNARANQLAHFLRKLGAGPELTVGLCLDRSVDLIVGLLGILKTGAAYVPLDPGLPKHRLNMILEDAGARVLVTRSELAEGLGDQLDSVVCLDTDAQEIADENPNDLRSAVSDQNLVYVIFTSGSTGRPKGVAVEHRQLINYVNAIWEKLDLPAGSSFATVSTIAADLGNTALFPSLCKGGTLHLIAEERATDPDALAEYFSRNRIDCLKIVPTHLSALLSASNPACVLPRRRLVLGGEACPLGLVEKIGALAPDCVVLNHYGPTEATVGAITNRLTGPDADRISDTVPLGRPIANVQAYVLDQRLRPVPIGAPGELYLGGAGLARGYINRADATGEKFIPSPFGSNGERLYQTGDLARYLGDGRIEFLGRSDDQVKVRGYRIEPGEIELALRQHAQVAETVVVAREDNPGDKRLVAYVVARDREQAGAPELRAFLSGKLPEYMTPSAFVFLDRLPLTLNGKVDRRALPAADHSRPDGDKVFAAPRNPIEATLAQIWSNVLGVDPVGVDDNFFDLGGDSILSIQIIARANQAGLGLSPRQLFQHQTVAELATVAGVAAAAVAEQGVVTGRVPLTPVQARFFALDQPELHHYNQAMLLEVQGTADASLFAQAIDHVLIHHDALRLRCAKTENGWQQFFALPDGAVPFEAVDLSCLAEVEQATAIESHAARLQASLNLQEGPIIRVALFNRGAQRNSYLLIVIHHLAVDGVSWRILLEDLQELLEQLNLGVKPSLPPKTTSFKTWAERLIEHARSGQLDDEAAYWLRLGEQAAVSLPLDHTGGTNTAASARSVSVSLSADETSALLQEVPVAYRTQINEVLLTALVRAFAPWTGSRSLLLDLEGHGREEIVEGVDLSRTVGWFTTIFPVVLDCDNAWTVVEALRFVKEQLRAIPNRGIGYALLRYAGGAEGIAGALRALPRAEVRFNYLGQLDRALTESSIFRVAPESSGPAQSPVGTRQYLLNVIGAVAGGELRLEWTYSENLHRRETVDRLAQNYREELRTLIAHARAGEAASYSPSDFPQAKLSQEDLDKVLARLGGMRNENRK